MPRLFFVTLLGLLAGAGLARAQVADLEDNRWPVAVTRRAGNVGGAGWSGLGPLLFQQPADGAGTGVREGFRPFWVQTSGPGEAFHGSFLYPLFSYSRDASTYQWNLLQLVRHGGRRDGAPPPASPLERRHETEIFPLWFSRETGDPERDYRGLFPLHGTVKDKLGIERASWTLFPLYLESERRGAVTTATPWPVVRITRGAAQGWGVWPLYERVERPGVSRETTYLWPLGYDHVRAANPEDPAGTPPRRETGFLPFYARTTGPGYRDETFLWPLFGYADRTQPRLYQETRYLWPLFVQARGEGVEVNRWAPFFTHSRRNGVDTRWIAWPLVRHAEWRERDVDRRRTQFLYFMLWSEEQRKAGQPGARAASLTHLWPLYSHWDNGAGRMQWQALSPLEVFFPHNAQVRQVWSPLLAVARHEQAAPGRTRTSLLWQAVTWERDEPARRSAFHLGPLLGVTRHGEERRIALGRGLISLRRGAGGGWRIFLLDFSSTPDSPSPWEKR